MVSLHMYRRAGRGLSMGNSKETSKNQPNALLYRDESVSRVAVVKWNYSTDVLILLITINRGDNNLK